MTRTIVSSLFAVTALALAAGASCTPKPKFEHKTLRGVQAQAKLGEDKGACEDSLPPTLPSAVYVQVHGGSYIYESQNGRASGGTRSEVARAGTQALNVRASGSGAPPSSRKIEEANRRYMFEQCMRSKGWTMYYGKKPPIAGAGSPADPSASERPQAAPASPAAPGTSPGS